MRTHAAARVAVPLINSARVLLACGIISSVLYAGMNVFIAMQWETYSSLHQTVSELSAIDAPTRSTWIGWGILYAVLVGLFGWGVRMTDETNRPLRAAGNMILIYAIICLTWPLFPMHLREAL